MDYYFRLWMDNEWEGTMDRNRNRNTAALHTNYEAELGRYLDE